jgi:fructuronate reductase
VGDRLVPILSNPNLFGVDLKDAGLDGKVEGMFKELIAGKGAVRATLKKYLD